MMSFQVEEGGNIAREVNVSILDQFYFYLLFAYDGCYLRCGAH